MGHPKRNKNKKINLIKGKSSLTIAGTFVLTFMLSLATSQILASHKQEIILSSSARAEQIRAIPFASEPGSQIYLPRQDVTMPDPYVQRKEFLRNYLLSKHSELANHVDALSDKTQWRLIIAIADAESSSCNKLPKNSHNCWGIGGALNLKHYRNYEQAIADVNRILENLYVGRGLDTPGSIVNKWVGHDNPDWEMVVQKTLDELKIVD